LTDKKIRATGRAFDLPDLTKGEYLMDIYYVMLSIQILSILLFFGLPIIARQIWLTTDQIFFIMLIVLFWLICSFVAIVSVYTWTAGFGT
tara:strand:- start:114 stop:383 length:270 start_codon:yes stop_codon:yes gene_type:complete